MCVQLFVTLWAVTHQAPLSMEFSRQKYWSALPFPTPGDLLNPGIEHRFPALQMDSLPLSNRESPISLILNSKADSICEDREDSKRKIKLNPQIGVCTFFLKHR